MAPLEKYIKLSGSELYLGNALDVLSSIPDESIDCIVTDPPYLLNYRSRHTPASDYNKETFGDKPIFKPIIKEIFKECKRVLKPNTAIYSFSGDTNLDFYLSMVKKLFRFKNIIVWEKNNWTGGDLRYSFSKRCEYIVFANKGKRFMNITEGYKRINNLWYYPRVPPKQRVYPLQKPVPILERMLAVSTNPGETVLDPFMGSGQTGVACKNMGRKFIGIEIDSAVFSLARGVLGA